MIKLLRTRRLCFFAVGSIVLVAKLAAVPQATAESLSNTNLVWDSETKATNIITGASEVNFTFNFTNVSSGNVTILNALPSCGCTTVQLPSMPWVIAPGTNGRIGVKVKIFVKGGTLSKTVMVDTDKGSEILTIQIAITSPPAQKMSDAGRWKECC